MKVTVQYDFLFRVSARKTLWTLWKTIQTTSRERALIRLQIQLQSAVQVGVF